MNAFTFSGSTADCFQAFLERHRWDEAQKFLADYCHVNKATVRRWKNGTLPNGEDLLRLRVLLDLSEYNVREFSELPGVIRQFGQAIALGLIEPEEAKEMLGYRKLDGIFTVLLRGGSLLRDKLFRLERWVGNSQVDLKTATAELRKRLEAIPKSGDELGTRRMPPPEPAPTSKPPEPVPSEPRDEKIKTEFYGLGFRRVSELFDHLRSVAVILAHALDENGAEAQVIRRELRMAIGQGELIKVAQDFERVLFEAARRRD